MEVQFYTAFEEGSEDEVELEDIVAKFSEFYDEAGRPEGDELDSRIMTMLLDVAQHFEIQVAEMTKTQYVFYPSWMSEDDLKELIVKED